MISARCIAGPWAGRLHEAPGTRFSVALVEEPVTGYRRVLIPQSPTPPTRFVYVVETVDFFGLKVRYWAPEEWRTLGLHTYGRKLAEAFDKIIEAAPDSEQCTVRKDDLDTVLQALRTRSNGKRYLSGCEQQAVTRLRREGLRFF